MGCCSVRLVSFISATLQLVCCIILLFLLAIAGVLVGSDIFQESNEGIILAETTKIVVIVLSVICLIAISLLIIVLVGIHQKRLLLISIFVYSNYVFLLLGLMATIAVAVLDINNKEKFSDILINILINLLALGLGILLLVPILILYTRMRRAPPILPTTYSGTVAAK